MEKKCKGGFAIVSFSWVYKNPKNNRITKGSQHQNLSLLRNRYLQISDCFQCCARKGGAKREPGLGGWGSLFTVLCISCLFKTCKHILSSTEYIVCEQEAYNAGKVKIHVCLEEHEGRGG